MGSSVTVRARSEGSRPAENWYSMRRKAQWDRKIWESVKITRGTPFCIPPQNRRHARVACVQHLVAVPWQDDTERGGRQRSGGGASMVNMRAEYVRACSTRSCGDSHAGQRGVQWAQTHLIERAEVYRREKSLSEARLPGLAFRRCVISAVGHRLPLLPPASRPPHHLARSRASMSDSMH
jgi:hypothetical protein